MQNCFTSSPFGNPLLKLFKNQTDFCQDPSQKKQKILAIQQHANFHEATCEQLIVNPVA